MELVFHDSTSDKDAGLNVGCGNQRRDQKARQPYGVFYVNSNATQIHFFTNRSSTTKSAACSS